MAALWSHLVQEKSVFDVSIIIAAYNCAAFVEHALASAAQQDGVSVEIIVVDDASTDNTVEVVQRFAREFDNLRIIQLASNGGPSAARNAGIEAAKGDWIAVLDADDAYLPGRLACLVAVAERSGADIIADNFYFFDPDTPGQVSVALEREPEIQNIDIYDYLLSARPYRHEADFGLLKPIFRRRPLIQSGCRYPAQIRHAEDFELMFELLVQGARLVLSRKDVLYRYTVRTSGMSRTQVNDRGMIERTRHIARRETLDARVKHLLEERAQALEELELRRSHLWRERFGRLKVLRKAVVSKGGRKWLAARINARLFRS